MRDKAETVALDVEAIGDQPSVAQRDNVRLVVAPADAGVDPARPGDDRDRLRPGIDIVIERGFKRLGRGIELGDGHRKTP
jgi:hypothetical protein